MRASMQMCKQAHGVVRNNIPPMAFNTDLFNITRPAGRREKVVFVMGPTGTGKSKLSIDLAAYFPAEIINSDKIQVYKGLDIVTNKVTLEEQKGVPHHLLSIANPDVNFDVGSFCYAASHAVESITMRRKLPIIVGGSNSYIEALVDDQKYGFRSKYDCCFLSMDVEMTVLEDSLAKRVDKMMEMGMLDELRGFFNSKASCSSSNGIRAAIGVPEFKRYLMNEMLVDSQSREKLLQEAVDKVTDNTRKLSWRQSEKIRRLKEYKQWRINMIDATKVFLEQREEAEEVWKKLVVQPSARIVRKFLDDFTTTLPSKTMRPYDLVGAKAVATTH